MHVRDGNSQPRQKGRRSLMMLRNLLLSVFVLDLGFGRRPGDDDKESSPPPPPRLDDDDDDDAAAAAVLISTTYEHYVDIDTHPSCVIKTFSVCIIPYVLPIHAAGRSRRQGGRGWMERASEQL